MNIISVQRKRAPLFHFVMLELLFQRFLHKQLKWWKKSIRSVPQGRQHGNVVHIDQCAVVAVLEYYFQFDDAI